MNTSLVKSVPLVDFEEISIQMPDWQGRFSRLVQDGKPIKYRVHTMPNLSEDLQDELSKRGYCHLIFEDDHNQHFLVLISK